MRTTTYLAVTFASALATLLVVSACSAPPIEDPNFGEGTPNPIPKRGDAGSDGRASTVNSVEASTGDDAGKCEPTAPNFRCSLLQQCGCGPNETCDITDFKTLVNSCVTGGSLALGRKCDTTSQCQPGLACIFGSCRPYCGQAKAKCEGPGLGVCVESYGSDGKPIPNSNACTINCDPMRPEGVCGAGAACLWFPTLYAPEKVSDCDTPGTKAELAKCTASEECKAGLTCAHHPTFNVDECERWCRLSSGGQTFNDCPSGFTCKDAYGADAPVIGGIKEGVCQD